VIKRQSLIKTSTFISFSREMHLLDVQLVPLLLLSR